MTKWIVFLRGINVGGNHNLPMAQLKTVLTEEGFGSVRTYIQSGNILLTCEEQDATRLQQRVADLIQKHFDFRPQIIALTVQQLEAIACANPFPMAEPEPKTLHIYFLAETAAFANVSALTALKKENESFSLAGQAFYLHAPDGIGRSKLAEKAEKYLGVAATARNWRTVQAMRDMAQIEQGA